MQNNLINNLIIPFRALRISGPLIISYLGCLVFAFITLLIKLDPLITKYLSNLFESFAFSHKYFDPILLILRALLIFITLPLVLTSIILPLRFLWIKGTLDFKELITDTFPAVRRALATLYFSTHEAIIISIPIVSMIVLYYINFEHSQMSETKRLFLIISSVVFIWTLWNIARLIAPVFIAIGGRLNPRDSHNLAKAISPKYILQNFLWLLLGIAYSGYVFIFPSLNQKVLDKFVYLHQIDLPTPKISSLEIGICAFIVWYSVAQIACTSFRAVSMLANNSGNSTRS